MAKKKVAAKPTPKVPAKKAAVAEQQAQQRQSPPAEARYAEEIAFLAVYDDGPRPDLAVQTAPEAQN